MRLGVKGDLFDENRQVMVIEVNKMDTGTIILSALFLVLFVGGFIISYRH